MAGSPLIGGDTDQVHEVASVMLADKLIEPPPLKMDAGAAVRFEIVGAGTPDSDGIIDAVLVPPGPVTLSVKVEVVGDPEVLAGMLTDVVTTPEEHASMAGSPLIDGVTVHVHDVASVMVADKLIESPDFSIDAGVAAKLDIVGARTPSCDAEVDAVLVPPSPVTLSVKV